jgi:hypothetical protein
MRKLVTSYTFNKFTRQVTSSEFAGIAPEAILLILDVTNNTIIYQPNDTGAGGSLTGTVLTLIKDTTGSSFSNSDNLQIFVEAASESVTVANFPATQAVSAASLPLPTGAASEAKQDVGNTSLSSINSKINTKTLSTQLQSTDVGLITNTVIHGLASGGGGGYIDVKVNPSGSLVVDATGSAVSVTNFPATQQVSAIALPLPAGAATEATLGQIATKTPALGQALSSASSPVVIASDQAPIPVTTSSGITIQTPTSNALAALNAVVQYQLETGGLYYLTVTNAPAATTAFAGTITFESSSNGTTWSPLTVMPVAAPSASAATSTTSTAGLYLLTAPASVGTDTIFIRAQMTSYTSGTAFFFASPAQANSRILIPWRPTVTSGQTVVPVIDVSNFSEVDIQLTAMTTTIYTAQATNDPTLTTWTSLPVQDAGQNVSAGTLTIFTSGSYRVQVAGFKWMRIQCTTTGTVATVQGVSANVGGPQNFTSFGGSTYISSIGGGTITTVGTVNTVAAVTASNTAIPGIITDVASAAITTTTTTATLTPTFGASYTVNIPVTVVSGTTPTLDVQVQESADSGTNWYPVYDFPRITATGSYTSPQLTLTGNRVRYVQTVTGTTPSFTRAINRLQASSVPQALYRQLIDRTVSLTTLNSTTPALSTHGAKHACRLVVNIGAAATPPSIQLQGSDDNGATFYSIGTPLVAVASSTVQLTVVDNVPQTLRAIVTSAGTGVTAGYVLIRSY